MSARPALLFLAHRIPYPPNKGDKLRSFHLLQKLSESYRVYLGTFVDDAADTAHVAALDAWCAGVCAVRLHPAWARILSLSALLKGEALSVAYYRSARLQRWVDDVIRRHLIHRAVVFSGPMAQYLSNPALRRRVIDFCDVDSAKWAQYAARRRPPMAWLYRREGSKLANFERTMAERSDASVFTTDDEAALFTAGAPEIATRVCVLQNGVDTEYFNPAATYANPYPPGGPVLVFTGAMDYWPNIDAAVWFAREVFPDVRERVPDGRFAVVGMNPASTVRTLARLPGVLVTGKVPDIRPWLAHAAVSVTPLRIARGVQNKVLEAMAMGRPVVASAEAATGLSALASEAFEIAVSPEEWSASICAVLADPARCTTLGQAGRRFVQVHHSWAANLMGLDAILERGVTHAAAEAAAQGV